MKLLTILLSMCASLSAQQLSLMGTKTVPNGNTSTTSSIVVIGDSHMSGVNQTTSIPAQISTTEPATVTNLSLSGTKFCAYWADMATNENAVDSYYNPLARSNILVIEGGGNDMIDNNSGIPTVPYMSPRATYDCMVSFANRRRSVGWRILLYGMYSRTQTGIGGQTGDQLHAQLNSLFSHGWRSWADAYVDISSDLNVGQSGNFSNATYFQADGIHIQSSYTATLAGYLNDALNRISSRTNTDNVTLVTSSPYSVLATDQTIICNSGTAVTLNLPNATAMTGRRLTVKTTGSATCTLTAASGQTIRSAAFGSPSTLPVPTNLSATISSDGSTSWNAISSDGMMGPVLVRWNGVGSTFLANNQNAGDFSLIETKSDNNDIAIGLGGSTSGFANKYIIFDFNAGLVRMSMDAATGNFSFTNKLSASALSQGINTVTFSTTPTFDLSKGDQKITLTANVTAVTMSNITAGQRVSMLVCQDTTGSRTFAWPTAVVHGATTIGTTASKCTSQQFESFDGTSLYAVAAGVTNQ